MNSKEWEEYKFGDIARLVKVQYLPNEQENLAYIGLEHIEQQTLRLSSIGDSSEVVSQKFRFSSGDILFGKLRPYFRKVYRPQFDGVCSTDIWVVRAREGFDQGFLFYFMANQAFVDEANNGSSGTRMPRADWGHMRETIWILPPSTTQHRIANILSALDEKIELNRQTNATLEAIAQAIFKEWFVHYNYPGATGERVDSELGPIPAGWQIRPLDDIADFLNGLALQKYPAEEGEEYLPVIKIRELRNGVTDSTDRANLTVPEKYIIENGDLIFSWSGSLLVKFWTGGKGALNQHLFKVTSNEFPHWFCYCWVLYHLNEFQRIAADKATTMGHIKRSHLTQALCLIPDNLESMDKIVSPIIYKMIENEIESETLAKIRDTLLPKLMRGDLDPKGFENL